MEQELTLKQLVIDLELVDQLYDYIRLIDPVKKQIITYSKSKDIFENSFYTEGKCHNLLDRKTPCQNCVSTLAIHTKRSIVKIEYVDSKIFLITSVPIEQDKSWYSIEIFKDITNDGLVDIEGKEAREIKQLVERKNGNIIKDAFTKVFNENYIHSRLPHDIFRARDENRKLALFLVNINNLKLINTKFGFPAGDSVLKEYSSILKKHSIKPDDWAARYGGKEFLVVLYDVDEKQAYRIRKRIHDKLSDYVLPGKPKSIEVSFDIGFTMLEDRITSADEFIFAARENISENGPFPEKLNAHVSTELLPGSLLTRREMEVAVLLLEGKSNNEIAHSYLSGFLQ